jgi:DNA-nicking Smr family endonuclease
MSRRRSLSEEERALWRGVARSIKPLQPSRPSVEPPAGGDAGSSADEAPPAAPRPPARHDALPAKKAPPLAPLAPLGRRLKGRVARGREPIDDRLDLHGFTQSEAHAALLRFLRGAQADGAKIALVVTGKGSTRGQRDAAAEHGVLKRMVPVWLALPEFRPFVVGFEDAHVGHGGQGALYVRLRRAR